MLSRLKTIGLVASLALAALFPSMASAACGEGAPRLISYTFQMTYAVDSIAKYNTYVPNCGTGIANSDTAPVGSSVLTDVFAKRDPIGRTLLMGITSGLPNDPEGQLHLVLFTNTGWADRAQTIAFGTLFPSVTESSLITALTNLATGVGTSADYSTLFGFADAVSGNMFSPNGDPAFQFGDNFTAIAFSNGQIIGSGTSSVTFLEVSAAPEPGTWAMMIVGFGAAGVALRRRRAKLAPA